MKPPASTATRVRPVREHVAFGAAAPDVITIGSAEVREIVATPIFAPGTVPFGKAPDPDARRYSFAVREGKQQLRGECSERARDPSYFGLGKAPVDLHCSCTRGGELQAALTLRDGEGEAQLPGGARFLIWEAHESAQGAMSHATLGYRVRNQRDEGGLDITREPRAYYPANLTPAQSLALSCLYTGLLMHRPSK